MQTRIKSALESIANFVTAFLLGLLVTVAGIDLAVNDPVYFVLMLNVLSTARHYIWRRVFNRWVDKAQ